MKSVPSPLPIEAEIDITVNLRIKALAAYADPKVRDAMRHESETLLCRNELPFRLRLDREGASNQCHAEVPIPNEGDLRSLRCPNCGGSL